MRGEYPFIILDCPPALDLLTLNSLVAADGLLVPMQAEYFALEGISELMNTLDRVAQAFNPGLSLEGVLLTMYDDRTNLSQQVTENLKGFFGEKLFKTEYSAEHPAGGGSEPRQAGAAVRSAVAGRGGVPGAGAGGAGAERDCEPRQAGRKAGPPRRTRMAGRRTVLAVLEVAAIAPLTGSATA